MILYLLSGLGADKRAFQNLKLSVDYTIIHIDWIVPFPEESIQNYAKRLLPYIDATKPFSLIGLSFGGIMATELSKLVSPVHTIIISSISRASQLPWYVRIHKYAPLYKYMPAASMKSVNPITHWMFGAITQEEKKFLSQILTDTDERFLKWALCKIIEWDNETEPTGLFHIHGSRDHIFPLSFIRPHSIIQQGSHLMIYNLAEEVSNILMQRLNLKNV